MVVHEVFHATQTPWLLVAWTPVAVGVSGVGGLLVGRLSGLTAAGVVAGLFLGLAVWRIRLEGAADAAAAAWFRRHVPGSGIPGAWGTAWLRQRRAVLAADSAAHTLRVLLLVPLVALGRAWLGHGP